MLVSSDSIICTLTFQNPGPTVRTIRFRTQNVHLLSTEYT